MSGFKITKEFMDEGSPYSYPRKHTFAIEYIGACDLYKLFKDDEEIQLFEKDEMICLRDLITEVLDFDEPESRLEKMVSARLFKEVN
jgi:hypothetical protein